jgi:prepilin-type processing-associated H-X9-DG protein
MLLPALGAAKQVAYRSQCLSNMRQLDGGLVQYWGDFNDYLMPPVSDDTGLPIYTHLYHWDFFIGRYYMNFKGGSWPGPNTGWKPFRCPLDNAPRHAQWPNRSYAVPSAMTGLGLATPLRLSAFIRPSSTYLLLEPSRDAAVTSHFTNNLCGLSASNSEVRVYNAAELFPYHQGATSILYLDGHSAAKAKWPLTGSYQNKNAAGSWNFIE